VNKITRRTFIKLGLGAAATALLPKIAFGQEPAVSEGPILSVARGDKDQLVKAAIDQLGGIEQFVSSDDVVCLKPNISFAANAECGATTSPGVMKQLVQLCLDAGAAKVVIVDYPLANPEMCIQESGIEEAILDKKKVSLLVLSEERQFAEVAIPGGTEMTSALVARAVLDADKFICVPTAKSHSATGVSLSMKGLMGVVWQRGSMHRMNLHRAIAELASVIKPALIVVDATRALTSGGPGGPGKTVELNTVVAGTDPVAVDSYTVGLTPWYGKAFIGSSVKHIAAAAEMGLGEIDVAKMTIRETTI
jgi:uncharacterized protein (DUF362 family)